MKHELVSLFESVLGSSSPGTGTENIAFRCPNPSCKSKHSERPRKLELNIKKGSYHCWVCHERGSSFKGLLIASKRAQQEHYDLLKSLVDESVDYSDFMKIGIDNAPPLIQLPTGAYPILSKRNPLSLNAVEYLIERGINKIDILRYNIHYVEGGRYGNRIIIPSYDEMNRMNYFTARALTDDVIPKYDGPKIPKRKIIQFENFINWNLPVILVEGKFDAMAVVHNAIPLGGTYLSKRLMSKLSEYRPDVYVCLDGEAFDYSIKICDRLYNKGFNVYNVELPDGSDPSKLGTSDVWEYINLAVRVNLKYLINNKIG